jgi:hypothetical protein
MGIPDVQHLRRTVVNYPSHRCVGQKKDKPLDGLMSDETVKRISAVTASEYFARFKAAIAFATEEGYIPHDFAASVQLKAKKGESKKNKRFPFQDKDLQELFSGPL